MLPGNYRHGGLCHRILSHLADGPSGHGAILHALGWTGDDAPLEVRKEVWRRLDYLAEVGLIVSRKKYAEITAAGLEAKAELDASGPLQPLDHALVPTAVLRREMRRAFA